MTNCWLSVSDWQEEYWTAAVPAAPREGEEPDEMPGSMGGADDD